MQALGAHLRHRMYRIGAWDRSLGSEFRDIPPQDQQWLVGHHTDSRFLIRFLISLELPLRRKGTDESRNDVGNFVGTVELILGVSRPDG